MSNHTNRTKLIDGDEVDAVLSPQYYRWRAGQRAAVKRRINRRERHQARYELRSAVTA